MCVYVDVCVCMMWCVCVCVIILQPLSQQGNLIPDPSATYMLYDRVVNVSMSNAVPFGLRGTIIGIRGGKGENPAISQ